MCIKGGRGPVYFHFLNPLLSRHSLSLTNSLSGLSSSPTASQEHRPPNSDFGGGWPAKAGGAAVGTLTLTPF